MTVWIHNHGCSTARVTPAMCNKNADHHTACANAWGYHLLHSMRAAVVTAQGRKLWRTLVRLAPATVETLYDTWAPRPSASERSLQRHCWKDWPYLPG
jgi:hypothetical protein